MAVADKEAVVCFRSQRQGFIDLGFDPDQVLTFGSVRGTNALESVERLHVAGRPMPPSDDLVYLAQVLHHNGDPISPQLILEPRAYGNQRYEIDSVDYADPRVAALLKARRDDELVQVIHRARLSLVEEQGSLDDITTHKGKRTQVRLVLHTSHVVPGLRVDTLHVTADTTDLNAERQRQAEERITAAAADLVAQGKPVSINAIARATGSNKQTIARALGTPVHTPIEIANKGLNRFPQFDSQEFNDGSPPLPDGKGFCAGGCGAVITTHKCTDCAARAVDEWAQKHRRRGHLRVVRAPPEDDG